MYFSLERWHNVTFHPFGILRHQTSDMTKLNHILQFWTKLPKTTMCGFGIGYGISQNYRPIRVSVYETEIVVSFITSKSHHIRTNSAQHIITMITNHRNLFLSNYLKEQKFCKDGWCFNQKIYFLNISPLRLTF